MRLFRLTKIAPVLVLAALLNPFVAHASLISLTPTSPLIDVNDGDTVSFDLLMDFTSEPTLGGGFDIVFDALSLQFDGFTRLNVGDPAFGRDPDSFIGLLSGWAFGDFNGLSGIANLGSINFTVLSTMGATTNVRVQDTASIAGPFISLSTFQVMSVTFNNLDLIRASAPPPPNPQSLPEPATAFMLGLGIFIILLRTSKKSTRFI